ncbi:MAG: c-type cytochrome [Xanthobacteraceae bacterium]
MSRSARAFPFALATVMLVALTPRVMAEGQMVGAETVPPPRGKMGIGRVATEQEIAGWAIGIRTDGQGLPAGKGSPKQGEPLYLERCAGCHGEFGEGVGRWPTLMGGKGTLASTDPVKSVGSYWPYASTLIDYIRRSMPFGNAQSLGNDELYAITAYVLYLNDLIGDESFELNRSNLTSITLPNQPNFHDDDRETAEREFWKQAPCMASCLPGDATIINRARALDVTPDTQQAPKVE